MENLPIINEIRISSIELLNGVYICSGNGHIETIIPEKFPLEIKELMKKFNLTWICFKYDYIIQFQTTKFTLSEVDITNLKDEPSSDIARNIIEVLLGKTFNQ